MAKITRYDGNLAAFASSAAGTERTVFGDTTQSDALDDNINSDFLRGWGIVGVNENPTKQDFNALGFTMSQLLAYLHQVGVPEWNTSQEYHSSSVANIAGTMYVSQVDNNTGNDPTTDDGTNWMPLIDNSITAATITPSADANVTLERDEYTTDVLVLEDGLWTSGHNIIVPDERRGYYVDNSAGSYDATIKTAAGTGVVVGAGFRSYVQCNGTNVIDPTTSDASYLPSHYDASGLHSGGAADTSITRRTFTTPEGVEVRVGAQSLTLTAAQSLDLDVNASWDDTSYATAANRAGKDFYAYYCQPSSGTEPDIILSANSTVPSAMPSGATPSETNTRKISGFHCLCADVGAISGHDLTGYIAGDILPRSVWDLFHRPASSPEGMVYSDNGIWVDIYLPSVSGGELVSAYGATIADGSSTEAFHAYKFDQWFARLKKKPIASLEFVDASIGSNQGTNITGSADPVTTGGHSDTAGRRMISNIGCEDMAGALWQWGREQGATNDVGSAYANAFDANDSDVAGQHYEAPNRPLFGGYWADGSLCGSRASLWNDSPLGLNANRSSRGVAEPRATKF